MAIVLISDWRDLWVMGTAKRRRRARPWDQGTRELNLVDRLLKSRTRSGLAALHPGNRRTGSDGAGGVFRMNPADALIGVKAATVQVVGDTNMNASSFQICL